MRVPTRWLAAVLALAGCRVGAKELEEPPFPLELAFEGQTLLDGPRLEELVWREITRQGLVVPSKAAVDDAAFALELFYRSRGYPDVRVDYEFREGPGTPHARFRIAEGPLVRVRSLELEGTAAFEQETLVQRFFAPESAGAVFDEDRLREATRALERFYLERGFLRFILEPPSIEFDESRTGVRVRLRLAEGPEFRVRAVTFTGGDPGLAARESQLARQHTGRLFLPVVRPAIEQTLVEAYRRQGFADVTVAVEAEADERSGDVRLSCQVEPGPRVRVAHFRIEGNVRTRDAAILSVVGLERGSLYDSERERQAFRDLYATGLFDSLELELEGTGAERTLVVRVVEARAVQIRLEPGWGSYEGPRFLLGVEENNFQGRAQILSLEGTVSPKAQALRLAWVDRDFLGSSLVSETTFFAEQREEPAFEFLRRGFGFFVRKRLRTDWSATIGYQFRPTDVDEDRLGTTLPLDLDPSSDASVAALSTALVLDDRDSLLLPTRGRHGSLRFEWADAALGSDTEFLRAQLEYTQLFSLGDETVLAAALRTGVVAPFGETTQIPLPERFFNGGENSVRSFEEDEIRAEGVRGAALGGEAATTLNLELRRELGGNLSGALFADAGNVVEDVTDTLDFEGFRAGLGFGLRYQLPIGPVRLDLGWNPDAAEDEDDYVLHFSVGFPF